MIVSILGIVSTVLGITSLIINYRLYKQYY